MYGRKPIHVNDGVRLDRIRLPNEANCGMQLSLGRPSRTREVIDDSGGSHAMQTPKLPRSTAIAL